MRQSEFEKSSGNVFANMELENAEELMIRARLSQAVSKILQEKACKQGRIPALLGIGQSEVSKLMNGR